MLDKSDENLWKVTNTLSNEKLCPRKLASSGCVTVNCLKLSGTNGF